MSPALRNKILAALGGGAIAIATVMITSNLSNAISNRQQKLTTAEYRDWRVSGHMEQFLSGSKRRVSPPLGYAILIVR